LIVVVLVSLRCNLVALNHLLRSVIVLVSLRCNRYAVLILVIERPGFSFFALQPQLHNMLYSLFLVLVSLHCNILQQGQGPPQQGVLVSLRCNPALYQQRRGERRFSFFALQRNACGGVLHGIICFSFFALRLVPLQYRCNGGIKF